MKKVITSIIITIAIIAGVGAYWYYLIPVTERYLIKVSTPYNRLQHAYLYSKEELSPQIKIENIDLDYSNDEDAIKAQRGHIAELKKTYALMMESEEDDDERIMILKSLRYADYYLLSFTHTRNFNVDEFLELLKKNGLYSCKVEDFCKKNKLQYNIYNLD